MENAIEYCGYIAAYIGYIAAGEILFIAALVSAKMGDLNVYGVSAWTKVTSIYDRGYFFSRRGKKRRDSLCYHEYF